MNDQVSIKPIRVLLIEDNEEDIIWAKRALSGAVSSEIFLSNSLESGLAQLKEKTFDIVISDINLLDASGVEVIDKISAAAADSTLVLLTGQNEDTFALKAMQHGAQDYILKGSLEPSHFLRAIRYAIERKHLKDELRATHAMLDHIKSDFVSTVSHELRTPLTIIREAVSLVFEGNAGELNADQSDLLKMALGSVDRLKNIINDLLDISKIEAGRVSINRSVFDIVVLFKEVVSRFTSTNEASENPVPIVLPSGVFEVCADRDRVAQVAINLVANAIKFTKVGKIQICIVEKTGIVECSITDTGIGVSQENIPRLFEKFYQVNPSPGGKNRGTGLGLAISKQLVELNGGELWYEKPSEGGSKFVFSLISARPKGN
jgi:signal transduction histidine kinase